MWKLKLELKSLIDQLQLIGCLVFFGSIAHLGYADLGMANHCTVRADDIPHRLTPAALCPPLLLHEPTITMLRWAGSSPPCLNSMICPIIISHYILYLMFLTCTWIGKWNWCKEV
jgi:hypothetical protein